MIPTLYWLTQNLPDIPVNNNWLSEQELSVLSGLRFEKRRNDWLLGRWTVKQAIRTYLVQSDRKLSSLEIRAASDGAPEAFQNREQLNISISISHAAQRSFCAVGPQDCAIGCDLEVLEPREDSLIHDYFTPEEIKLCFNAPPDNKPIVTNLIWSAKESMLKSLREGLRMDTRSVQVHPQFGNSEQGWKPWTGLCPERSSIFHGWWRVEDGFVYTIASSKQFLL